MRASQIVRGSIVGLAILALTGSIALAQPSMFVSRQNRIVRVHDGAFDAFDFDPACNFAGMGFGPQEELWVLGRDTDGDGNQSLYRLEDPFGTPNLVEVSDGVSFGYVQSLCWVGSTLYITGRYTSSGNSYLATVDPSTGAITVVGATGYIGIRADGAGLDPASMTMYAVEGSGNLYTVDWLLQSGPDPDATAVGSMGVSIPPHGLDFCRSDGMLYGVFRNTGATQFQVHAIDPSTASSALVHDLSAYMGTGSGSMAIAVIPEPATALLLAMGGLAVLRRRRG